MMKKVSKKRWVGARPKRCGFCKQTIKKVFIMGKTHMGTWWNMCLVCHAHRGVGLGLGLGYKYELQGREFIKTAG